MKISSRTLARGDPMALDRTWRHGPLRVGSGPSPRRRKRPSRGSGHSPRPQHLLHRLALRQLVDQFIEVPHLAHERVLDLLDPIAADHAGDQEAVRVHRRRLGEKGLEVCPVGQQLLQLILRIAGQPADDLVHLRPRPPPLLRLGDVVGIDAVAHPLLAGAAPDADDRLVRIDSTPDGVVFVTINRPAKKNAFDAPTIAALFEAFETLQGADHVRAGFVRGSGGTFCAGADLAWMRDAAGWSEADNRDDAIGLAEMLKALHDVPALTVA